MKLYVIALLVQCMSIALVIGAPVDDDDVEDDVPPPEQHTNRFTETSMYFQALTFYVMCYYNF